LSSASVQTSNTQTIARNSVWFGIELFFSLFAAFLASVFVARVIGPQRLGYFQYLVWITNITAAVGSMGLPMTTRKYMAEYLNRGEPSVAKAVYRNGLLLQTLIASGVTVVGLGLVFFIGDPAQRPVAVLLVAAMAPRMIGLISSQANNAAELMKRSTAPALTGGVVTIGLTLFSLWIGWDLLGVASSMLLGAAIETVLKLSDVHRRLSPVGACPLPPELKKRMLSYSGQGVVLMLLSALVWDRSDVLILKSLNPDIQQVTFFSLAFNLSERVLMIPNAFLTSLGVTMMAQLGRDSDRLRDMLVSGTKYSFLIAFPLLVGMACLSRPMVLLFYGHRYEPLIIVLTICALLAIPKALASPPSALLQATENQGFLIWVGCICGALDVLLDVLLTPRYGARGAALANGFAQTGAAVALWVRVYRHYRLNLRLGEFGRVVVSGGATAAVAILVPRWFPTYAGMASGFCIAVVTWFLSLRLTGAVNSEDAARMLNMAKVLPGSLRPLFTRLVGWLSGGEISVAPSPSA